MYNCSQNLSGPFLVWVLLNEGKNFSANVVYLGDESTKHQEESGEIRQ